MGIVVGSLFVLQLSLIEAAHGASVVDPQVFFVPHGASAVQPILSSATKERQDIKGFRLVSSQIFPI